MSERASPKGPAGGGLVSGGAGRALAGRAADPLVGRRAALAGTVYLLLDLSASMADDGKMRQLVQGAVRFFYEAWRLRYAVGVIGFARRARVLTGATRSPYRFQRSLAGLEPNGSTAMAPALRLATARLQSRRGRRVVLLITDGMPDSREDTLEAAAVARGLGLVVVAVGTDGADEAFLRALTPRPELARMVPGRALGAGIGRAAEVLRGR